MISDKKQISRRRFLKLSMATTLASWTGASLCASRRLNYPDRLISLYHAHTGEKTSVVYWSAGRYLTDNLAEINWVLRDHHTNDVTPIDPRLLNIVYLLQRSLSLDPSKYPILVLSAYRTRQTNEYLRQRLEGVARNSFHLKGRALDFNIPGVDQRHVHKAALALAGGGVGYYPDSKFIHLDSGPFRIWKV